MIRNSLVLWVLTGLFALWLPTHGAQASDGAPAAVPHGIDLNRASRAEIESARGIGVATADRILEARENGPFLDWSDFRRRVKSLSAGGWRGLAEQGYTLQGQAPPVPIRKTPPPQPAAPSRRPDPVQ